MISRALAVSIPAIALISAFACTKDRVSEADCTAYVAHFAELAAAGPTEADANQSKQVAEQMKEELQQKCLIQGTAREIECARKATTLAVFQACGTAQAD